LLNFQAIYFPEVDDNPDLSWGGSATPLGNGIFMGPWFLGGVLYAFMDNNGLSNCNMYSSTDVGRTWTRQGGNAFPWESAPTVSSPDDDGLAPIFDPVSGKIIVVFRRRYSASGTTVDYLGFKDFDPASNTWSSGYAVSGPWIDVVGFVIKSDGDRVCIGANETIAGDSRPVFAYYSGTTWSSTTLVADNVTSSYQTKFYGAILDPASQNIHCLFSAKLGTSGTLSYYHRVIKSDYSLGPITTLDSYNPGDPYNRIAYGVTMAIFAGKLFIWRMKGTSYYAQVGNSSSLPTSFTLTMIADAPTPDYDPTQQNNPYDLSGFITHDGSKLSVFYIWENAYAGEYTVSQRTQEIWRVDTTDGSTWSDPVFYYSLWPFYDPTQWFSIADLGLSSGNVDGIHIVAVLGNSQTVTYLRKSVDGAATAAIGNRFY